MHLDLPKLLGHELQAHFKPLQDLPQRMFTLLMQLKNIRTQRGERSALPCSSKKASANAEGQEVRSLGGELRIDARAASAALVPRFASIAACRPWR